MGKTLIIAEKPSVAGDIAKALGGFKKVGDHFESDDKLVSSAVGHLVELFMPEDIDKNLKRWSLKNLPILPEKFRLKPIDKTKDRLLQLKKLIARPDVTELVNACDAGREGELIFTYIYEILKCDKPFKRLWFSSMTKSGICSAFERLRGAEEMQSLQDAARCRSESDWLVGINGTRAVTSRMYGFKVKAVATVGRVQTPTLALVVERENEIENFKPRDFWRLSATFGVTAGTYAGVYQKPKWKKGGDDADRADRLWERAEAERILAEVKAAPAALVTDEKKRATQIAPRLYDLTTLQREANQRFGLPAGKTLSIAQALYEKHKALTYPRTDSRALPDDYAPTCRNVLAALEGGLAAPARVVLEKDWVKPFNKRIFNNAQVSDHFAIIPTGQTAAKLSPDERKIYDMVALRFIAAFYPVAEFDVTTRLSKVGAHTFKTEGKVLVNAGWKAVYGKEAADEDDKDAAVSIPPLGTEDGTPPKARVDDVSLLSERTKPPARYSEATLLAAMEGAGKFVEDEELAGAMKEKGLGTPATRAAIIDHLLNLKYMERQQRELVPTAKAQDLIRFLEAVKIDDLTRPALTGDWECKLRRMEHGELSRADFMKGIREMTTQMVERTRAFTEDEGDAVPTDILAPDGQTLLETLRCYRTPDKSFTIYKTIGNRKIEPEEVRTLMQNRSVGPLDGFRSKLGRPYSATLQLDAENKVRFVFPERKDAAEDPNAPKIDLATLPAIAKCPKCGGDLVETPTAYLCRNAHAEGTQRCSIRVARTVLGKVLPKEQIVKMMTDGKTDLIEGFRSKRTGKFFSAFLMRAANGFRFQFPPRAPRAGAAKKKSAPSSAPQEPNKE